MGKTHIYKAMTELGFTEAPGVNRYHIENTDLYALLFHKRIGIRVVIAADLENGFCEFMHTDKDGNVTDEQKARMKEIIVQFMLGE